MCVCDYPLLKGIGRSQKVVRQTIEPGYWYKGYINGTNRAAEGVKIVEARYVDGDKWLSGNIGTAEDIKRCDWLVQVDKP